jgi:PDZ domain-containing secreted protein
VAGIKLDERGLIDVDGAQRTSVEGIWAIGDLVRGPALAHKASDEGIIAVEDSAGLAIHPLSLVDIPRATFCTPNVASFGLTEAQAKEAGYDVVIGKVQYGAVGAGTVYGDRTGIGRNLTVQVIEFLDRAGITRFDGKIIEKSSDLPRLVGNVKPGTRSPITVFRRGTSRDLMVTVAEIEPEKPVRRAAAPEAKPPVAGPAQAIGLVVAELNDAQKKELKLRGGVRVESVDGAAARAGLREGDVIVAIANAEVLSVKDFEQSLAKIDKTKTVNVLFRRGDLAQYALIRPGR